MAYDEAVADRIRALLEGTPLLTEKKMFGGLGFMVGGNMAVAASGQGGILVRVDPAEGEQLIASTAAHPMEMRGRAMSGWLRVDTEDVADDEALEEWVHRGATYAGSLPPKQP
jgi:TfoX/Sxy family transcriptional regulator of competence genes